LSVQEFIPGSQFTPSTDDFIGMTGTEVESVDVQGHLQFGFNDGYEGSAGQVDDSTAQKDTGFGANFGVQNKEGWFEIASTNLAAQSVDAENSIVYATFDPVEELLWAGTASGRLCSHLVQYAPQDCRWSY
jgi:hypothetical protein